MNLTHWKKTWFSLIELTIIVLKNVDAWHDWTVPFSVQLSNCWIESNNYDLVGKFSLYIQSDFLFSVHYI